MGKNKYIETPEKLWEYFEAYRKTVKSKPILVQDFVGAMASEVERRIYQRLKTKQKMQGLLLDMMKDV